MSVLRLVAIATISTLFLFSCAKEDLTVQPGKEITTAPDSISPDSAAKKPIIKLPYDPVAVASAKACGNSMQVGIQQSGNPTHYYFQYEIRISGTAVVVDSGMIKDGESTHAVLSPCQDYDFVFWGSASSTHTTTQEVKSDGCDGVYSC